jgi:MtrB/PioB family decaheme-associated outer membrane protein
MKAKTMILAVVLSFMPLTSAFPLEDIVEGEVSVEGILADVDGEGGGKAKFTEYRDLKENGGVYGRARLKLDTDKYFMNLNTGDYGYKTQYYILDGGMWGKFKADAFYDQIPHNLTFDARTYFEGAGHYTLTGVPNTNVATWNTFNYSIDRQQYGGGFKVDLMKPFFFDVAYQQEKRDGIKPAGIASSSPGGFDLELPEPIHYTTNNLKVEAGYGKKPFFLSAGFIYSDFYNDHNNLNFTTPVAPFPTDTLTLPPDNKYYKGFFKGNVKLPWNSTFNVNVGYSSAKSDATLLDTLVSGGTVTNLILSTPDFDGKIDTTSVSAVLTSHPLQFLNAKLFYNYYNTENKNNIIFQDDGSGEPPDFNRPFQYKTNSGGIDLGFKLPANFYLSGGYQFIQTIRKVKGLEFVEVEELVTEQELLPPNTNDNLISGGLRWSGLDFLSAKFGYQKLYRTADFDPPPVPNTRRFAYAGQNRSTYSTTVDIFPIENLNFSLDYQYKITDYKENFGLKQDKRQEFDASADYIIGKIAKIYGFGDIEYIRLSQPEQCQSPVGEWNADQKDRGYGYGIGTEVYVIPKKLTLLFQYDYVKSNGSVDFTLSPQLFSATTGLGPGTGANNNTIDISNWDDYKLASFRFKAVYNFTKSFAASLGYVYQSYQYSDAQLNNYQFINPPGGPVTGSNGAYLTGAYKDQSYRANLIYGGLSYSF